MSPNSPPPAPACRPSTEPWHVLQRVLKWSTLALVGYATLLALLTLATPQRALIYLHWARWPLGKDFRRPEGFGLAPGSARYVQLKTADAVHLGAWHVLPESVYQQHHKQLLDDPTAADVSAAAIYEDALRTHGVVIYLHGNAASRGHHPRVEVYKKLAKYSDVNVLTIDYRGFADSEGTPSEAGLVEDAHTAWRWLQHRGVAAEKITVLGHSLGTGVAVQLTAKLSTAGSPPRALILKAPFTSVPEVAFEFPVFKYLPLL
ncbi:Alpha/Beta hydrolase protein, partial [Thamnocephalis sphaerospora]